ncbi:PsbP domain-containing protein 5, chloroplastic [Turnera subulata]|uniref:PsbP domain-containing protein 5, chloroplastic n=1 Tax=Turnera subulata TaxID=218843 RepID=A0A9Q0JLN3_9ROSI|nr:PsbP domain-containing protein 5, chloroplastic [Turnera subulata]
MLQRQLCLERRRTLSQSFNITENLTLILESRKWIEAMAKAMALHCSLPLFTTTPHYQTSFREQGRILFNQMKCKLKPKTVVCECSTSSSTSHSSQMGFCRRDLVLFGISSSLSIAAFPSSGKLKLHSNSFVIYYSSIAGSRAEEDLKMASFVDDVNAYTYSYPTELPSQKFLLKWVESRKPERYSSAAPLSPDARLRIVSERVDIIDNLIISVTIGPPNYELIKSKDKTTWAAKDVADSLLSDKSSLRVTSSQRVAERSILESHSSEIDGEPYWYCEYLVRKSPTKSVRVFILVQDSNVYRHYIVSTAERDGYFYSLNASTLDKQWGKMGPLLEKTVASFRLIPPTDNYVPPYKDPWRFW